jgi:hypothetical protein
MALKYYEYISETKIDMLLPQVPLQIKQKVLFRGRHRPEGLEHENEDRSQHT